MAKKASKPAAKAKPKMKARAAKASSKKPTVKKALAKKGPGPKPVVVPPPPKRFVKLEGHAIAPSKVGFSKKDVEAFYHRLIKLREKVTGQITFLANDSLKYVDDTPSDDRTDDFDREFALNLVSSEHDVLFEIDDAMRRIELGTYGQCDECAKAIEKPRLNALPFARLCVKCQSAIERGKVRFRPFGETLEQGTEANPENTEPEETE